MIQLDEAYWTSRYDQHQTGWDIGEVSTPIKTYIDHIDNKGISILIPGAGNAYEAEYLWNQGFRQVDVLDISTEPLQHLQKRVPDWPNYQLIHKNFFDHEKQYDLIIEQTFFCALTPDLRKDYVVHMHRLLKPEGKLVGLLFNVPLNDDQPPFGGDKDDYEVLFSQEFYIQTMEVCYNSIGPRANRELWINMRPKI